MSTPPETTYDTNALARRWRLDVNVGTDAVPDWQQCVGLAEFTPAYPEPNNEDSSDYDSGGWTGNTKTAQSWELGLTINRKISEEQKAYHPVHEALRLAGIAFGAASKAHVRYYDRDGMPEAYEGKGVVQWAPSGGETTDLEQVEITITGDGALTSITNPAAETP
jgi:hypothetical protein